MREDCLVIATALHHRMERLSASALQDEVLTVIDLVSHLARNDLRLRVLRGEQAQIGHHRYARIRTTSSSELDILLSRSRNQIVQYVYFVPNALTTSRRRVRRFPPGANPQHC
jgi:hypothetical protein